jgi:hypothetical protein
MSASDIITQLAAALFGAVVALAVAYLLRSTEPSE